MKRLFWFGAGIATGVYATRRVSSAAHRITPAGVGENIADGLRELGAGIGAFGAEVRAGMAVRESELAELVERRAGAAVPTYREALSEQPRPTRARRAGM